MADIAEKLKTISARVESALWEMERSGLNDDAQAVYRTAIDEIEHLDLDEGSPLFAQRAKALAYTHMRLANLLRQDGHLDAAAAADEQGLESARQSGDQVTIGQLQLSIAGTALASGDLDRGSQMLEKAAETFDNGDSPEMRQGSGWTHILRADAANAGLLPLSPEEVIVGCEEALGILEPIENWPGVARAHQAKGVAYERLGDAAASQIEQELAAEADRRSENE